MPEKRKITEEEKAQVVFNNGCAACAVGAVCLADGPIPDAEIVGLMGLEGIFG